MLYWSYSIPYRVYYYIHHIAKLNKLMQVIFLPESQLANFTMHILAHMHRPIILSWEDSVSQPGLQTLVALVQKKHAHFVLSTIQS